MTPPTRCDGRDCGLVANASEKAIVGKAVPGVPSGVSRRSGTTADKFAHRGQICPTERRGRRSLRGNGKDAKRKAPLSLELIKRQRRTIPLRYHSCSGKCISGTRFAVSGGPGVSYWISDRCSEGISKPVTLLPRTKRQLSGMWGRRDLSSSWRWGYYLLGV